MIICIILSPNPRGKNLTHSHNNPGTKEYKSSKVCIIKILLDSGASINHTKICPIQMSQNAHQ